MEGRESSDDGFALIETIVAFVILATAMAVAVETISQSMKTAQRARDLEKASQMLDGMKVGTLFRISQAGISDNESSAGASQIVARQLPDDHKRPLFDVTVTLWPQGKDGPQFTYRTFSSGSVAP